MGSIPLPPLPGHLLPMGCSIPVDLGCRGEAATAVEGINPCLTIPSPAPARMGLEWLSLVPRTPVLSSQPLGEGSLLLLLLPLLGGRGASPSPSLQISSP